MQPCAGPFDVVQKRDTNGHPYTEVIIGTVDVPINTILTERYDVAAWYRRIAVTPGVHPVLLVERASGSAIVSYAIPGTIVETYMPSLFGGVALPDAHLDVKEANERERGTPHVYRGWLRPYEFAQLVAKEATHAGMHFGLVNPAYDIRMVSAGSDRSVADLVLREGLGV